MANNENHLVIMAGGIGSRFWPMSTPECPKQFIDVLGCGRSLLQLTADRFKNICPPENVWVAGTDDGSVVVIEVPQGERDQLPVYLGRDPFRGSYRRSGDGDYRCNRVEVWSMLEAKQH